MQNDLVKLIYHILNVIFTKLYYLFMRVYSSVPSFKISLKYIYLKAILIRIIIYLRKIHNIKVYIVECI